MTKVRNCVIAVLSSNVNNIISLVVRTFPQEPTV
ncbi:protein YjjY, partial [Escherichia coli]